MAIDISAAGSKVMVTLGTGKSVMITMFSDEGTPFECPDADFSDNKKELGGTMISSRVPATYVVSVTLVPNSDEDMALMEFAQKNALQPGNVTPVKELAVPKLMLMTPKIDESAEGARNVCTWTWLNGRLKSAPTGPSTSAEGRLSARTYVFEFEKMLAPAN